MINSGIEDLLPEFEAALENENDLLEIVRILRVQGLDQLDIYLKFEDYQLYLIEQGRDHDPETDNLYSVLERIYGWCREDLKLFGRTMNNDELKKRRSLRNEK
jgi:hypothetical protein